MIIEVLSPYLRPADGGPGRGSLQSVSGPEPKSLQGNETLFILCFTLRQCDPPSFSIVRPNQTGASPPPERFFLSSFGMKKRNVKCFFKEKRPDFPSSRGGNHLDQSVLWHRDVIKLLMSLNGITCDRVAGSFHSGATVLFPKLL